MGIPSHEERLLAWKYTYAYSSLIEVETACRVLLTQKDLPDPITRALVAQVVVSYNRPFTKSQLTEKLRRPTLADDLVPADFKEVHSMLRDARDGSVGHSDATAFPGTPLNRVLVRVHGGEIELHRVSPGSITPDTLVKIAALCDILAKECRRQISSFVKSHLLEANLPNGDHFMSTDTSPEEWLVPAEKFWPRKKQTANAP